MPMSHARLATLSFVITLALAALPSLASARTLTYGTSGTDVTTVQQQLIAVGYLAAGNANGHFGPLTLSAVKKFQCAKGIVCSGSSYGIVGPQTQAALNNVYVGPAQPSDITATSVMTPAATGKFEVSGWVPDWRAASGTADVLPHLNQMASVMPFGFTMSDDGHVLDNAHLDQDPWTSLIQQAKAQHVRVVPTIEWGNGDAIDAVLSDTTKRIALEDEIANLVKQRGYDGIDIDFEAKQAGTVNYFSTFLKGLYQRMGSKWVYCTAEARQPLEDRYLPGQTVPSDATEYANDYAAMNKYCDRVELMAYDQGTVDKRLNVARSAPYAPVADPGWVEDLVRLAAQTISRNKLIIGIPTYGYEYQVTPVSGGYQYKVLWAFNPTYGLQIANQLGITPRRTSADEIGFTYDPNALNAAAPTGNDTTQSQQGAPANSTEANLGSQVSGNQPFNYMTWSDAQAIQDKVNLAHTLGVRGVALFSIGGAEDQQMWNILK
jgi:spore germination protein